MRTSTVLVVVLVAAACKGEPARPDAKIDALLDAYDPPWWTPAPGEAANWDIQLVEPIDVTEPRTMYDLDLWQVTPARTLTYADSSTVAVPAGSHAGVIETLHGRTPRPIVVCHLHVATVDLANDPDRTKFPGNEPSPPDDPDLPKAGSVIGWSTNLPTGQRWLDVRPGTRGAWADILKQRIQLAKDVGCDAIEVDHGIPPMSFGFGNIDIGQVESFLTAVAATAHQLEISAGIRNPTFGLPDQLKDDYDWTLVERCAEFQECDAVKFFIRDFNKAAFAIDYMDGVSLMTACARWAVDSIRDGIYKQDPPAGDFRMICP